MKNCFTKVFMLTFLAVLSVFACRESYAGESVADTNRDAILKLESIKENYLTGLRSEAIQTRNSLPRTTLAG